MPKIYKKNFYVFYLRILSKGMYKLTVSLEIAKTVLFSQYKIKNREFCMHSIP